MIGKRLRLTDTHTPRLNTTAQIALDSPPLISIEGDGAERASHDTHPASNADLIIHDHGLCAVVA
jgi:hypothetical protein